MIGHVVPGTQRNKLLNLLFGVVLRRHDLRVGAALQPETEGVGQVEVEDVELEVGQFLDVAAQPVDGEELAALVDHQTALGFGGPVAGRAGRDARRLAQQLQHRARAVERAGRVAALDADRSADGHGVALGRVGAAKGEEDVACGCSCLLHNGNRAPGLSAEIFGEGGGVGAQLRSERRVDHDAAGGGERVGAGARGPLPHGWDGLLMGRGGGRRGGDDDRRDGSDDQRGEGS